MNIGNNEQEVTNRLKINLSTPALSGVNWFWLRWAPPQAVFGSSLPLG